MDVGDDPFDFYWDDRSSSSSSGEELRLKPPQISSEPLPEAKAGCSSVLVSCNCIDGEELIDLSDSDEVSSEHSLDENDLFRKKDDSHKLTGIKRPLEISEESSSILTSPEQKYDEVSEVAEKKRRQEEFYEKKTVEVTASLETEEKLLAAATKVQCEVTVGSQDDRLGENETPGDCKDEEPLDSDPRSLYSDDSVTVDHAIILGDEAEDQNWDLLEGLIPHSDAGVDDFEEDEVLVIDQVDKDSDLRVSFKAEGEKRNLEKHEESIDSRTPAGLDPKEPRRVTWAENLETREIYIEPGNFSEESVHSDSDSRESIRDEDFSEQNFVDALHFLSLRHNRSSGTRPSEVRKNRVEPYCDIGSGFPDSDKASPTEEDALAAMKNSRLVSSHLDELSVEEYLICLESEMNDPPEQAESGADSDMMGSSSSDRAPEDAAEHAAVQEEDLRSGEDFNSFVELELSIDSGAVSEESVHSIDSRESIRDEVISEQKFLDVLHFLSLHPYRPSDAVVKEEQWTNVDERNSLLEQERPIDSSAVSDGRPCNAEDSVDVVGEEKFGHEGEKGDFDMFSEGGGDDVREENYEVEQMQDSGLKGDDDYDYSKEKLLKSNDMMKGGLCSSRDKVEDIDNVEDAVCPEVEAEDADMMMEEGGEEHILSEDDRSRTSADSGGEDDDLDENVEEMEDGEMEHEESTDNGHSSYIDEGDVNDNIRHLLELKEQTLVWPNAEKYFLSGPIGHGTFGVVFRAVEQSTGNVIAMKTVSNAICMEIEKKIIQMASEWERQCPYLCIPFDYLTIKFNGANVCIFAMELLQKDLYSIVFETKDEEKKMEFPTMTVVSILGQLFAALAFLAEKEIVFTDVKLENVMLKSHDVQEVDGKTMIVNPRICLIDVNAARLAYELGGYCQTDRYRAPEVLLDLEYDERVDTFSAGVLAAEMLLSGKFMDVCYDGNAKKDFAHHIQIMEATLQEKVPTTMLRKSPTIKRKDIPRRQINPTHTTKSVLAGLEVSAASAILRDFLPRILAIDPESRPSSSQAAAYLADVTPDA